MTEVGHRPGRDVATPGPASAACAAAALGQFVLELREVRRASGDSSYATLVQAMNGEYSKATISRVLNGAEPSWRFTRSFLAACGVTNAEIAAIWHPKWTGLRDALRPLAARSPAAGAPYGEECPICGGWTTNPQRHAEYHRHHDATAGN
ncbi:helix-turn-helix domain-containing protein [Dactylosporangium sp. CA-092794]|uniref:helix-turn-helix domain-containing protein n=1 Tax=Dactylosporangium sp. CA-092794 TaxID=3239929 RepID=UPI003D8E9C02